MSHPSIRRRQPFSLLPRLLAVAAAALTATAGPAWSQHDVPTIEEKTGAMERFEGFIPFYWDGAAGQLWLEVARFDADLLYVTSLAAGIGSNDIGLDRGQLGGTHLVVFRRVGPKVLLVERNTDYRATTPNADERRAVEDAFGQSVHWGFTIGAATGDRVLVDATDFLLRDAHDVGGTLRPAIYRVDKSRSALYLERTRAFPQNTELEATLTFTTDAPNPAAGGGRDAGALGRVVPSVEAVTVRQHHSFVELPGPGYVPRRYDPRSGFGALTYVDYAAPLGEPMAKRFLRRHRLEKRDPSARVSEAIEPIVYYLDRGTPEPVRSALLEGARWWNQAFEAAGYRDAFRVELMPEGADMLDVRYNVIQWVHRSTRGWSYGASVTDPRTGEIIKGHVTLGSLRVRQDYLIAEGLLSPYETGAETPPALAAMALARLRQLAAHEVGHTLGLGHNYYDSEAGRISVMDYPHPLVRVAADGSIDLSDAYATGIGEWDKISIAYGYQEFPPGTDEAAALDGILGDAWARDLRYFTNQDMDVHPRVDWWALGTDMAAELERVMNVRRTALRRFGEAAIPHGTPMALMEEALVPLFLHHRYQVEATASVLGGQDYIYAIRGDGREPSRWVDGSRQRAALEALVGTLRPEELMVPAAVIGKLPPRPAGFGSHRELFPRQTGGAFDVLAPATVAADMTVSFILMPDRAARLVEQHALDPDLPGLDEVIGRLAGVATAPPAGDGHQAAVARAVSRAIIERIMWLAGTAPMPQVRAVASLALEDLQASLERAGAADAAQRAHDRLLARDIKRFLDRPAQPYHPQPLPEPPPGAPIGQPAMFWFEVGCGEP